MKNLFHEHFKLSDDEFKTLWEESIIALDANILLNLYRYSESTKNEFISVLNALVDKIWMPHQAAEEYFRNRLTTTSGQISSYLDLRKSLGVTLNELKNNKRHPFVSATLLNKFEEVVSEANKEIHDIEIQLNKRINSDEIQDQIGSLFSKKVGAKLTSDNIEKIILDGAMRYLNLVPPGFKDTKKKDLNNPVGPYGDLIIWNELINKAKSDNKSIIFVSDDKKEDWWLIHHGRTIGPHPSLIREFRELTSQKFHIYAADQFIERAIGFLNQEVNQEVLKELSEVREELAIHDMETKLASDNIPHSKYLMFLEPLNINYFILEDSNDVPLIQSESFETRSSCMHAIRQLQDWKVKLELEIQDVTQLVQYVIKNEDNEVIGETNFFKNVDLLDMEVKRIKRIAMSAGIKRIISEI